MSVELSSAQPSLKSTAKSDSNGKMPGKANANSMSPGGNFALMLNMLSASDAGIAEADTIDTKPTDVSLSDPGTVASAMLLNMPALPAASPLQTGAQVGMDQGTVSQKFVSDTLPIGSSIPPSGNQPTLNLNVAAGAMADNPPEMLPAQSNDVAVNPESLKGTGIDVAPSTLVRSAPEPMFVANTATALSTSPNSTALLSHESLLGQMQVLDATLDQSNVPVSTVEGKPHAPSASGRQEAKDVKVQMNLRADAVPVAITSPDIGRITADWMAIPASQINPTKSTGSVSGVGLDGSFGPNGPHSPHDNPVFEVTQATAIVPEPALAETVSYWASHGVQTAELTLEGFGEDPVEVSIVLNGDQALIEFRTDQAEVREVLENASDQLKEMLSGEGLQLTGMSVGSSGKGDSGGKSRQEHSTVQKFMRTDTAPTTPLVTRSANPSVGRSLDLFV